MFEKLFTTKMSPDKKIIENRFAKMINNHSKLSKLISVIIFGLILAGVACISLVLAVSSSEVDNYYMTDKAFMEFVNQPVENARANFIYADSEKLFFYCDNGIFVYNLKENKIQKRFDLRKFNCAPLYGQPKGTRVFATRDGREIHIVNYDAEEYEHLVIDLKNNSVKNENRLINVAAYPISLASWPANSGWHSEGTVSVGEKVYFLHTNEKLISSVKLVINYPDDTTELRNVFELIK